MHGQILASFPSLHHLQSLMACSMQIRRREAWENWSHVVVSGKQIGDTGGAVPDEAFLVVSVQRLEARAFTRQRQCCSLFMMPGMGRRKMRLSQASPFRNCKLQAVKDWRWERPGNEAIKIQCTSTVITVQQRARTFKGHI